MSTTNELSALEKIQAAYENNKKRINTITTVVLLAVVGFVVYANFILKPKENKAATALSYAQQFFAMDSLNLALNGDNTHPGFVKIIKKYSGTKSANLAHYYAGVCYLRTGEFKKAISELEAFNGKGTAFASMSKGCLGDAYMETNNTQKAIDCYMDASANKADEVITPMYLLRAAMANEMAKNNEEAKRLYIEIRDQYATSPQARDVEKNLARLGELGN
jgi:predicted negative regulator of RcsB-dependent stress response